jgi:triosephosphate isomerase (TIM)
VAAKVKAVFRNGMVPICCVGEKLEERELGVTRERLATQVELALDSVSPDAVARMVIAYEPIWAIGTGRAATPDDAQDACSWIRETVARCASPQSSESVRIQYGGSVTEENAESLLSCPDVDGALVGGASLDNAAFVSIIRAAVRSKG